MVNRTLFFIITTVLCFTSCNRREYYHDNSDCIYKNFINSDSLPFSLAAFNHPVTSLIQKSNKVTYLNSFYFSNSNEAIISKLPDSMYRFLNNEYFKCLVEYELNKFGSRDLNDVTLHFVRDGEFYYCGNLNLQSSVQSILFKRTYSKVHPNSVNELILYNLKNNLIRSIVLLSEFANEHYEEDLYRKTFLISSKSFLQTTLPSTLQNKKYVNKLKVLNNNVYFDAHVTNTNETAIYSTFYIDPEGYVVFSPNIDETLNISILEKEGNMFNFSM